MKVMAGIMLTSNIWTEKMTIMTYFLSSEVDGWLVEYVYSSLVLGSQFNCLCIFLRFFCRDFFL
jgi:hypothetical protein